MDFFAGSGTTGDAAARNGREFTLIDRSPEAAQIMSRRLAFAQPECVGFVPEPSGDAETPPPVWITAGRRRGS